MIQANPGNLLKFNRQPVWQRHKQPGQNRVPFGLKCPSSRLMPFQLFFPSGAGVATWKVVNPVDDTGATFTAMDAGDLTIETAADGSFWVTWYATADLTNIVDCGFWEVWVTVDGVIYYSEVLHSYAEELEPAPIWRLRMGNSMDKENVLYQSVYQQIFYPTRLAWDRPEIEREVKEDVDGFGNVTHSSTRTVARFRLEFADVPDYCIPFFAKVGDLDSVVLEDTVEGYAVTMTRVEFDNRAQGIGLNVGIFTFDAEVEAFNGCQENFEMA
jgi:hypothetical protein